MLNSLGSSSAAAGWQHSTEKADWLHP